MYLSALEDFFSLSHDSHIAASLLLNYDFLWGKMLMKILESTKKHFSDSNATSQYTQSFFFLNGIVSLTKSFCASTLEGICVSEEDSECIPPQFCCLFP